MDLKVFYLREILRITPIPEKFTVAIGLNTFRNSYGAAMDIAPLMAMATLSVLPILLLFVFAQKYFVQGITTTGLK